MAFFVLNSHNAALKGHLDGYISFYVRWLVKTDHTIQYEFYMIINKYVIIDNQSILIHFFAEASTNQPSHKMKQVKTKSLQLMIFFYS